MAIAALSVDPTATTASARRARALGVAVRFAIGHAILLAVGAGLLVLVGWSIPSVVERGGEMLGGALLIVMGTVTLWGSGPVVCTAHSHRHGHEPRAHWHLHVGRRDHHPTPTSHSHLPTMIGAAFAVSSLRALAMLTPFGDRLGTAPLTCCLSLIVVFAVGDSAVDVALRRRARPRALDARAASRSARGPARWWACPRWSSAWPGS